MSFTVYDTQRLTSARLELVSGRGRWRGWLPATLVAALVIAGAVAIGGAGSLDVASLLRLNREQARLQGELQRTRLELDVERATRTELERRNQALGEQVTELNQRLEFVNSRTQRQTTTPPPPPPADNP
jgi:cell division protein FtsB